MRQIKILDTTLRDGEQSPGFTMNLREKLELARQLERLRVDIVEAGFPVTSPEDFQAVQAVAAQLKDCSVTALSRACQEDILTTYEALKGGQSPILHLVMATSDLHMEYKLKMTRQQVLERIAQAVSYARSLCPLVQFSAEDATRSDRQFLLQAYRTAAQAGATTLSVTDTVGYATPNEMEDLVSFVCREIQKEYPVEIAAHCHNDLGMATANSIAAIRGGAGQVEGTINGIGERAGNAALEEVIMGLYTRREDIQAQCRVDTRQLYRTSKLLSTISGIKVPPNKAIVGRNAFAHEAGIHQHGILANPQTYEIITPETVGIYQTQMVLGKHSGKHAFAERIGELGYVMQPHDIDAAFERFKVLADRKKDLTDRDIEALVSDQAYSLPETFSLCSFVINSGTVISATAVVRLQYEGQEYEHVARGEGPIDAAFKAIDRITRTSYRLRNYSIQAVTGGEDALGEVVVKIEKGSRRITGRGLSPDIIEASIRAYLNAINKAIYQLPEEEKPDAPGGQLIKRRE